MLEYWETNYELYNPSFYYSIIPTFQFVCSVSSVNSVVKKFNKSSRREKDENQAEDHSD
jgi:hypothetical protein